MSYTFNWRLVYNLAVFSLHAWFTGHVVAVNMETGKPFCVTGTDEKKSCGGERKVLTSG